MRKTLLAVFITMSLAHAAPAHAGPITWMKSMIRKLRRGPSTTQIAPTSFKVSNIEDSRPTPVAEPAAAPVMALPAAPARPARQAEPIVVRPSVPVAPAVSTPVAAPAARPLPASFALVDPGRSYEGAPAVFASTKPSGTKILYFHGAGAATKDGIIERLAPALHAENVHHEVISLPYDGSKAQIEQMIASAPAGSLIVAGHSAGGAYVAHDLLRKYPAKFKAAFLINPATPVSAQEVPTLLIRGSEDHRFGNEGGANVAQYLAEGGDHSLRFRIGAVGDKQAANASAETAVLVKRTARQIKQFLAQQDRPTR
jgi:predicted alpha/beta-hydrolase family hydrolase